MPDCVELVVLNRAPLGLAGRVALAGRLLFDDAPPERVRWQADTRLIWLDERPHLLQRQQEWRGGGAGTWRRCGEPGSWAVLTVRSWCRLA